MASGGGGTNVGGISASIELETGKLEASLKAAEDKLRKTRVEIVLLHAEFTKGVHEIEDYRTKLHQLTNDEARYATQVTATKKALRDKTAATSGSLNNYTTVIQQTGYALGDLASTSGNVGQKLMSVSNNVQFAAAGFGPWGVAIGIAFTGVAVLVQNLDALKNALGIVGPEFDSTKTKLENLEATLKRLEAKTWKLRIDHREIKIIQDEIKELQEGTQAWEEAHKFHPTGEQQKGAGAIREAMVGAPGGQGRIADIVYHFLQAQSESNSAELKTARQKVQEWEEKTSESEFPIDPGGMITKRLKAAVDHILGRMQEGNLSKAGLLVKNAAENQPEAVARLGDILRAQGKAGLADLITRAPQRMAAKEEEKEGDKAAEKRLQERQKEEQEKEDEEDRAFNAELQERRDAIARRNKNQRERVNRAKRDVPGIEEMAEAETARRLASGISQEELWAQMNEGIKNTLMGAGFNERDAALAAEDLAAQSGRKLQADIVKRAYGGGETKMSEVFGSGQVALQAQQAVSNKLATVPEKLDEIKDLLAEQMRKAIVWKVKP